MGKWLLFHPEMISTLFLWGNGFLRGELRKKIQKIQILKFLRVPSIQNLGVYL